jgi:hypothetical protein
MKGSYRGLFHIFPDDVVEVMSRNTMFIINNNNNFYNFTHLIEKLYFQNSLLKPSGNYMSHLLYQSISLHFLFSLCVSYDSQYKQRLFP